MHCLIFINENHFFIVIFYFLTNIKNLACTKYIHALILFLKVKKKEDKYTKILNKKGPVFKIRLKFINIIS